MTLSHWQKLFRCHHYGMKTKSGYITYIPPGSREPLSRLTDYRLVRTDMYRGSYVALLEKRK